MSFVQPGTCLWLEMVFSLVRQRFGLSKALLLISLVEIRIIGALFIASFCGNCSVF